MSKTIGEVITALRQAAPDAPVYFSFCRCSPDIVRSWRGIYAEPAIGWKEDHHITASELLDILDAAIAGQEFHGYKGGTYTYKASDTLHVDSYGECTNTEIERIEVADYCVVLHTIKEG